jgi:predicted MFS family arabinose efflux permease
MTLAASRGAGREVGALFRLPGYGNVAVGSLLWHTNRWGSLFATTLLLAQAGASPLRIQLIGALFFAPMLVGAVAASAVAAIATPRAVVLTMQLLLTPVQVLMFVAVELGRTHVWTTALFMLFVGMGNTVNMTSQRMLIHKTAGDSLAPTALTIEPLLSGVGAMAGSFGTGVLVDRFGSATAFGALALLGAVCAVLTARIPRTRAALGAPPGSDGRRFGSFIRGGPILAAMIAVTVVMNLFLFGYTPLVPKIAERFTGSAAVAGLLTAAAGLGQVVGGVAIAAKTVRRRGVLLFVGSAAAIAGVLVFALSTSPSTAFVSLFVAGLGQAGFSAMQSVIAAEPPDPVVRAAALGVVSTAVGAMPLGMLLIGAMSEWLGARGGVLLAALLGLSMLTLVGAVWRSAWIPFLGERGQG